MSVNVWVIVCSLQPPVRDMIAVGRHIKHIVLMRQSLMRLSRMTLARGSPIASAEDRVWRLGPQRLQTPDTSRRCPCMSLISIRYSSHLLYSEGEVLIMYLHLE